LQDAAFLADAQKQSLPIETVRGDEAEQIVRTMYAASPMLVRKVKEVID
jgi:hypothetical protein